MNAKIANLDDRTVLVVAGPDARDFLHNVVTADVAALEPGDATYSALLTPQGKVLFDFFVFKDGERFVIDCADEQAAALLQRLTMYKLRADVTITPESDAVISAAWGGEAPSAEQSYADPRTSALGGRVVGAIEANATLADYHAHRIALGIADTAKDIGTGEVFPHEANMDQLGAISFSKGCYIGQEVVSRMQHRGTARTRFVIASADHDLTSGEDVTADGRRIGQIKSVAGHTGLALLRLDRAASALASGNSIEAGGIELKLAVPAWAQFNIDQQKGDAG